MKYYVKDELLESIQKSGKSYESLFKIKLGDLFIAMSDGVIHAGVGQSLNFGWERPNVIEYAESRYQPDMSAKAMASVLRDEVDANFARHAESFAYGGISVYFNKLQRYCQTPVSYTHLDVYKRQGKAQRGCDH